MPTYTYLCDACRREYEIEQRISDSPLEKCPKCGKKKAHRVITNGNFILKGSGWYSDGYSSKKRGSGASSTKSDSSSDTSVSKTTPATNSEKKGDSTKSSSTSASAA